MISSSSETSTSTANQCDSFTYIENCTAHNNDLMDLQDHYIIDVKPKRKVFRTTEERKKYVLEYKKRYKTELCKTFQINGSCRYGDSCSFAHGVHELKAKSHLHSNYKTKPCQQFFEKGYCLYGKRCQYLHSEVKYVKEFREFLLRIYNEKALLTNKLVKLRLESIILEEMSELFLRSSSLDEFYATMDDAYRHRRLNCFKEITQNNY